MAVLRSLNNQEKNGIFVDRPTYDVYLRLPELPVCVPEGVEFALPFHQDEYLRVALHPNLIAPLEVVISRLSKLL